MAPAHPASGLKRLEPHDQALDGLFESLLGERPANPDTGADSPASGCVAASACGLPLARPPLNDPPVRPLREVAPGVPEVGPPLPYWAEGGFRALFFRIGEFRFGMPLVLMRSIFTPSGGLTRVPGQAAWHCGLARHRGESVVVADFGLLLGVTASCVEPRYLLLIGDGQGALACDRLEDALALDPTEVRWSRPGSGPAWLAGFLPQQMCGLLDAEVVGDRIRHG